MSSPVASPSRVTRSSAATLAVPSVSPSGAASPSSSSSEAPKSPKSPSRSSKRLLGEAPAELDLASAEKRARPTSDANAYRLNVNNALDKQYEHLSFNEIIKLPPSALQGLASRADNMFKHFKVHTIEDLANWRFFRVARAIESLSKVEEKDHRSALTKSNINKALDQEHEKCSFNEMLALPVSALQGLAQWTDAVLSPLGIKNIQDLANFKFAHWAVAFVDLAQFESTDFSS